MIQLQFSEQSAFTIQDEQKSLLANIPKRDFTEWLQLPEDPNGVVEDIERYVKEKEGQWDKVIAIGMGGSALGIVTLQKAFFPFDERLIMLDNLDANTLNHVLDHLDPERTLVLVISKSGGTLETMTNYQILKSKYTPEQYQQNFVAITDPKDGILRSIADEDQLQSFPIPAMVGGRFSVLTAVGLLPHALLGGDVKALLKGAKNMLKRCEQESEENPALQLAVSAYELSKPTILENDSPKSITSFISYSDQLYSLGLWYQQLLAESIGKTRQVGLTPLPLRGASDQHSVLQLLQDGPNDKLNIFLDLETTDKDVTVPGMTQTVHDILRIEGKGTEQALREDGRPTIVISIPKLTEEHLGELFMLFQMQIALLGELYHIDAFNQPGVEKSKKLVKAALQ